MCKQIITKEKNYFSDKNSFLGRFVFVNGKIQVLANKFIFVSVFIINQFDTQA